MTGEELDAIEARARAATPGPWESDESSFHAWRDPTTYSGLLMEWVANHDDGTPYVDYNRDHSNGSERPCAKDAAFIVAARADVPALLAEVRRLRALEVAMAGLRAFLVAEIRRTRAGDERSWRQTGRPSKAAYDVQWAFKRVSEEMGLDITWAETTPTDAEVDA